MNRMIEQPGLLGEYQVLAVPGGFSYGDDVSAGKILANQLAPVAIAGRGLMSGQIAGIDHDIPLKRRRVLLQSLRLSDNLGQTLTAALDVGRYVRAACGPYTELPWPLSRASIVAGEQQPGN